MPEESTMPDSEEAVLRLLEALNRRDFDAALSMYTPDVVFELAPLGFAVLEEGPLVGREAIRRAWEDWTESFEDFEFDNEDHHDLGSGVTFGVLALRGRPRGSDASVEARGWVVTTWRDGRIARATSYKDVDGPCAAAERLAQERG
jgi:ketosteroid isomerase-like protein